MDIRILKIKKILLTKGGAPRITAGLDDDVTDFSSPDAKASMCCLVIVFSKGQHKKKLNTKKKYLTNPERSDRLIGLLDGARVKRVWSLKTRQQVQ